MFFEEKMILIMVIFGLSLLNENIIRLVLKIFILLNCINMKLLIESKIIFVMIKIVGVVGVVLVFVNIFLWVYEYREWKKEIIIN